MQFSVCVCFVAFVVSVSVQGFTFPKMHKCAFTQLKLALPLYMSDSNSDDNKPVELVPLDKVNIENSAAVTGGVLGLVLGGPVFGLIFAAITNYVAKNENEAGEAIRGVGKTVIGSYNFLNKLNAKYGIANKIGTSIESVASSSDSEVVEKTKTALETATSKIDDLNNEYDLVGKGKELLVAASTLSDAALDKVVDLNKKYDFVGTAKKTAVDVIEKVQTKE